VEDNDFDDMLHELDDSITRWPDDPGVAAEIPPVP
jgi:hypothetical protein